MNMKESYIKAIEWLSGHPRNGTIIRVKTESELRKYQEYFISQIESDLFLDDELYKRIEWRVDPSISK